MTEYTEFVAEKRSEGFSMKEIGRMWRNKDSGEKEDINKSNIVATIDRLDEGEGVKIQKLMEVTEVDDKRVVEDVEWLLDSSQAYEVKPSQIKLLDPVEEILEDNPYHEFDPKGSKTGYFDISKVEQDGEDSFFLNEVKEDGSMYHIDVFDTLREAERRAEQIKTNRFVIIQEDLLIQIQDLGKNKEFWYWEVENQSELDVSPSEFLFSDSHNWMVSDLILLSQDQNLGDMKVHQIWELDFPVYGFFGNDREVLIRISEDKVEKYIDVFETHPIYEETIEGFSVPEDQVEKVKRIKKEKGGK